MENDDLGNRMKSFEMIEAGRILLPGLPIMVRLDGKNFSNFTRGLERPYDKRLTDLMIATAMFLVKETNALVAYHQSDEISLILYTEKPETQLFFDGRVQKLTSVISSMATAFFNRALPTALPEKADKFAFFDCRVWNVPSTVEAANVLVWRELDATKNAISMAAQHYFSHTVLQNKNGKEMQEMLWAEKGINFNDYPSFFKRGSYIRRVKRVGSFSVEEIETLPMKHEARTNPNLQIERSVVERVELPKMTTIKNKVDVLFHGATPIVDTSK